MTSSAVEADKNKAYWSYYEWCEEHGMEPVSYEHWMENN